MIERLRSWYVFRLRWWWRKRRGRCPLGPPLPCPEMEEVEIHWEAFDCVEKPSPAKITWGSDRYIREQAKRDDPAP